MPPRGLGYGGLGYGGSGWEAQATFLNAGSPSHADHGFNGLKPICRALASRLGAFLREYNLNPLATSNHSFQDHRFPRGTISPSITQRCSGLMFPSTSMARYMVTDLPNAEMRIGSV